MKSGASRHTTTDKPFASFTMKLQRNNALYLRLGSVPVITLAFASHKDLYITDAEKKTIKK